MTITVDSIFLHAILKSRLQVDAGNIKIILIIEWLHNISYNFITFCKFFMVKIIKKTPLLLNITDIAVIQVIND